MNKPAEIDNALKAIYVALDCGAYWPAASWLVLGRFDVSNEVLTAAFAAKNPHKSQAFFEGKVAS